MEEIHDIVIVGGGISGLATALALQRKGIKSIVLERHETLRSSGAAIGMLINGWRALDELGVGRRLREKSLALMDIRDVWIHKDVSRVTPCRKEGLRCLRRSDLIDALASSLPAECIRVGCQVVRIEPDPLTLFPTLYTREGEIIKAKVLIGCDGWNSVVAKCLGLAEPKTLPNLVIRGITKFSEGHQFGDSFVRQFDAKMLLGMIPIDHQLIHWFLDWLPTSTDMETSTRNPQMIKELATTKLRNHPPETLEMVRNGEPDSLSLARIRYRSPWDLLLSDAFHRGTTCLTGDAMHVMGPFLGQGGAAALEDAVVLSRNLAMALRNGEVTVLSDEEIKRRVGFGMGEYVRERRRRIASLGLQSYLMDLIFSGSNVYKLVGLVVLMVFFRGEMLKHTEYDCGRL
ncbi:monooxygenase 1-like [Typha angustifolia]|uniref:monooxygenase 1-like n=1 Tax=Typha angustifolia TaxID=59011 RepID=UPI003C2B2DF0